MTIHDFIIINVEFDKLVAPMAVAKGKHAVIIYKPSDPEIEDQECLVVYRSDYDRQTRTYVSTFKGEDPLMTRLRVCEHFLYIHDVIEESVIPARPQDYSTFHLSTVDSALALHSEIRNQKSEIV